MVDDYLETDILVEPDSFSTSSCKNYSQNKCTGLFLLKAMTEACKSLSLANPLQPLDCHSQHDQIRSA
ncbi:MAG: hypothetical protein ACPG4O_12245, partial [bacterium]